jgi:hypothetical protein
MDEKDIRYFAQILAKQGSVYFALLAEDRELVITDLGLDVTNPSKMSEFLHSEMLAMGLSEHYVALLQELLLIPPGSDLIWEALVKGIMHIFTLWLVNIVCDIGLIDSLSIGIRKLRRFVPEDNGGGSGSGGLWEDQDVVQLLQAKSSDLGGSYAQVSLLLS